MTSNHFFCPPNEKNLSKTATAKLYPANKMEAMHKNKPLSGYIYSITTLQCKLCLIFVKTGHLFVTYIQLSQRLRHQIPNPRVLGFKTAGWLQGQLSLSSFLIRLNEYQELLGTEWN